MLVPNGDAVACVSWRLACEGNRTGKLVPSRLLVSCLVNLAGTVDGERRASYSLTTLLKADPATDEALHSFEFESNTRRGKPPPNRRLARFASATPADASHYAEATSKGLLRLSERPCSCRRRRAFSRGLPGSGASLPRLLGVRVLVNSSAVFEEGGGEDFDQGSSFCSGTRQAFPSPPTTANNSSRIPRNHCHPASASVSLPGCQIGWISVSPTGHSYTA